MSDPKLLLEGLASLVLGLILAVHGSWSTALSASTG